MQEDIDTSARATQSAPGSGFVPRLLKRSLAAAEPRFLRMRIIGLTIAQCTFALITVGVAVQLAGRGSSGGPFPPGVLACLVGVCAVLLALHAAAIAGFWMGRQWALHAAFLACSPYLLVLGGMLIVALLDLNLIGFVTLAVVAFLLGAHIVAYESDEARDELVRWRRLQTARRSRSRLPMAGH